MPAYTIDLQDAVLFELHESAFSGYIGCKKL